MANRDLLKEAIADAKSVKEAAIANAKAALEEAFTPYLKEKFTAKLAEMEKAMTKLNMKRWMKTTAKRKWKRKCQIQ
jgi:TATA-binding protein-associated factor Taf7